jgi:hypothetical protein
MLGFLTYSKVGSLSLQCISWCKIWGEVMSLTEAVNDDLVSRATGDVQWEVEGY